MGWFVVALAAFVLWWPKYDLEVALAVGPSDYEIVERDFYTLDGCREASKRWKAYDWSCLEKTTRGGWFNSFSPYNARHQ